MLNSTSHHQKFGYSRLQPQHIPPLPKPSVSAPQLAENPIQTLTTVFVGNITEKCSNELIQDLLKLCGPINSWKRLQDISGKYQAFGFCEFAHPEGTLRALRLLNKFQLGDKKLTVKTDEATSRKLTEFERGKSKNENSQQSTDKESENDAYKEDIEVCKKIVDTIKECNAQLIGDAETTTKAEADGNCKNGNHIIVSRSSNRSSRTRSPEPEKKAHRRRRSRSTSRTSPRRQMQRRTFEDASNSRSRRTRSPSCDVSPKRSKRKGYSRSVSNSSRSSSDTSSRGRRSSSRRHRHGSSGGGHRYRHRSGDSPSAGASEDIDDLEERRRLKAEIKRKEQSYLKRLAKWEERERRMAKQYECDEQNEVERRKMIQREAKKLRQFLEDYDDERDDPKYYKSSSLFQRRRNYERERELDIKDRQEEVREIEELKQQILSENNNVEDIDAEARRLHQAKDKKKLKTLRAHSGSPTPHRRLGEIAAVGEVVVDHKVENGHDKSVNNDKMEMDPATEPESSPGMRKFADLSGSIENNDGDDGDDDDNMDVEDDKEKLSDVVTPKAATFAAEPSSSIKTTIVGGAKITLQKPALAPVNGAVFGDDDDEDEQQARRKIRPFEITREDRIQAMTPEERRKLIKELIERIPTSREPLFAFRIAWEFFDEAIVEGRVRPWINKKIRDYIGEEEPSLVAFICEKIAARAEPKKILADLAMVFDDEAEVFMIKLWRLIIYESEAKKLGLNVSSASGNVGTSTTS